MLVALAVAGGVGYVAGTAGGPDVSRAERAGTEAGQAAGARAGEARGFRTGYASARSSTYRKAYRGAYPWVLRNTAR